MNKLEHLEHLVSLMAEPFREAWKAHCWRRAKELAAQNPELADLPEMLAQAVKSSASTPAAPSSAVPNQQPERTESPSTPVLTT